MQSCSYSVEEAAIPDVSREEGESLVHSGPVLEVSGVPVICRLVLGNQVAEDCGAGDTKGYSTLTVGQGLMTSLKRYYAAAIQGAGPDSSHAVPGCYSNQKPSTCGLIIHSLRASSV